MTDQFPEQSDEERVRRLLADARPDAMPDHVAARLDATLESLVAERSHQEAPAPARRRWAPRLLAAAAAVVVLAGTGYLWQQNRPQATESSTAGSADSASSYAKSAPSAGDAPEVAAPQAQRAAPVTLTRTNFAATARRLSDQDQTRARDLSSPATPGSGSGCTPPPGIRAGDRTLEATYDKAAALLVLRAPTATGQRVEAWSCAGDAVLDSTVVPR